ncbi:hypothetical protein GCM10011519_08060 [Marmoricola endophyticus]|uniref:Extracellular solute-binding protein n=1 Tax=Marmoricola endophyticus TaxID=2040280 RepID=A0A917BDG1_9ACTN|nr:extracellular solute-binding protein [Marmoricola endophyticus]GGF36911.1 hypothetical protein GCM10011519_08060 [Marmoricola endophyticus]
MRTRRWQAGMRVAVATATAGLVCIGAAACTPDGQTPAPASSAPAGPAQVTLAVYGPDAVNSAYTRAAAAFSAEHPEVSVSVKPYASREQALAAADRDEGAPDIFLADHDDLDQLLANDRTQPVSEMLTERNIDLGDNYQRIGVEDFSRDNALQCMPAEVSPTVVYYNAGLVRLSALRPPGDPAPNSDSGWRFNDFVTAIQQASARGGDVRGFALPPRVESLAPFLFSGGSTVVDDADDPTRLELSEGSGLSVMKRVLPVLRNPSQTVTSAQLAEKSAVQRFKDGELAMIAGQRDLVPQLRATKGLSFGVMPIPRVGSTATTGTVTGFCVSRGATEDKQKATAVGDLLAYLVGDDASTRVAATGYVVPANLTALNSDEFTQSDLDPLGGDTVFSNSVRYIQELPSTQEFPTALAAADRVLRPLFNESVSGPLDEDQLQQRLLAVDQAAQRVLAPASLTPTPSPSAKDTPSISPTGN